MCLSVTSRIKVNKVADTCKRSTLSVSLQANSNKGAELVVVVLAQRLVNLVHHGMAHHFRVQLEELLVLGLLSLGEVIKRVVSLVWVLGLRWWSTLFIVLIEQLELFTGSFGRAVIALALLTALSAVR